MNFIHIDNLHVNPAAVEMIEQNGSEVCIYLRSGVKLDIPDIDAAEVLRLLEAEVAA